jgi:hypothetical protein
MNAMTTQPKPIPIYTTRGDSPAFLMYPHLYNRSGDWCGFVTNQREVYSVHGEYVGWLDEGPRILRKRSYNFDKPKKEPPSRPSRRMYYEATIPLPPMMKELSYEVVDVLEDWPDLLPTVDAGEFREDME